MNFEPIRIYIFTFGRVSVLGLIVGSASPGSGFAVIEYLLSSDVFVDQYHFFQVLRFHLDPLVSLFRPFEHKQKNSAIFAQQ
jgi:hypothetical protein